MNTLSEWPMMFTSPKQGVKEAVKKAPERPSCSQPQIQSGKKEEMDELKWTTRQIETSHLDSH